MGNGEPRDGVDECRSDGSGDSSDGRGPRAERFVESVAAPMCVVDDACRVVNCNEAMTTLFYAAESSLRGTSLADLLPPPEYDRLQRARERAVDQEESATCCIELPDSAGADRRFDVTVSPLAGEDGHRWTVGVFHDVTERERRESELDLLRQVLVRVLRHDVRTGLTVVRGQAEVLAERTSGEEREMAETIVQRSEELVETTEKARAIEQVIDGDGGRTTIDLRSTVNRAVANVAAAYPEATYDARITDRVPVRAHRAFPYAVENLVENAVEHSATSPRSGTEDAVEHSATSPRSGTEDAVEHSATSPRSGTEDAVEHTTASGGSDPHVTVSATVEDDHVDLHVVDDGPGIAEEELEVIDEREETPLKHGTGVGLWLVDWIVDRSGGDLSFDTGPEGTTVTVRLRKGDPADLGVEEFRS